MASVDDVFTQLWRWRYVTDERMFEQVMDSQFNNMFGPYHQWPGLKLIASDQSRVQMNIYYVFMKLFICFAIQWFSLDVKWCKL